MITTSFTKIIWNFYQHEGRDLEWRRTKNPYHIFVSEIMLQQTQVSRVTFKYKEFIDAFPDVESLAQATIGEVYNVWQGMGYNRRALFLKRAAEMIIKEYGGVVPDDPEELQK